MDDRISLFFAKASAVLGHVPGDELSVLLEREIRAIYEWGPRSGRPIPQHRDGPGLGQASESILPEVNPASPRTRFSLVKPAGCQGSVHLTASRRMRVFQFLSDRLHARVSGPNSDCSTLGPLAKRSLE